MSQVGSLFSLWATTSGVILMQTSHYVLAAPVAPENAEPTCDDGWTLYPASGKGQAVECVFLDTRQQALDWATADTFCQKQGGHLVSVHNDEQNNVLLELVSGVASRVWIGGQLGSRDENVEIVTATEAPVFTKGTGSTGTGSAAFVWAASKLSTWADRTEWDYARVHGVLPWHASEPSFSDSGTRLMCVGIVNAGVTFAFLGWDDAPCDRERHAVCAKRANTVSDPVCCLALLPLRGGSVI